jgi:hypothetical protein
MPLGDPVLNLKNCMHDEMLALHFSELLPGNIRLLGRLVCVPANKINLVSGTGAMELLVPPTLELELELVPLSVKM